VVSSQSFWDSEVASTQFEADVEIPLFVSPASLALSNDQSVIAENFWMQPEDTVAREAESSGNPSKKRFLLTFEDC